jgi:hypothetical protein
MPCSINLPFPLTQRHARWLASATLVFGAASADAHDTWFERVAAAKGSDMHAQLLLGTGNRYPVQESGVDMIYLARQGCHRSASDAESSNSNSNTVALSKVRNTDTALLLHAPARAHTCWAQLQAFDVTVPADKVALYFREIQAPKALQDAWASQRAQGLDWTERYTKHARIALATTGMQDRTPLAVDMLIERSASPEGTATPEGPHLRAGQPVQLRVLRDGQPVAGLAVELQTSGSRFGAWRRTDEQGRAQWPGLPAGSWLARATDLRPASANASHGQRWESDFVTLAFEVVR